MTQTLRKPIPRFCSFIEKNVDTETTPLYPFPCPSGERAIAVTNGEYVSMYETSSGFTGSSLNGFVPHIEDALKELYEAIYSEPDPQFTKNGKRDTSPTHVFDIMLFDRDDGKSGRSDKTNKLLDEWSFDPDWPAPETAVCALILSHLPYDMFVKGTDIYDLWQRRAQLKRGLLKIGMNNPYSNPCPILRFTAIAPISWDNPTHATAPMTAKAFWKQVDNCLQGNFAGCMVIDVFQPWSAKGNAFQLITEEDVL